MDNKLLMDTAVLAGEIMLKSGAETYRVEDTMTHILRKSDAEHVDPVAFSTALLVTMREKDNQPISVVRRVKSRGTNLNNIVRVNDISRRFCKDEMTLSEAHEALLAVRGKQYSSLVYNIATVLVVFGFALFFGGTWVDAAAGLVVGCVLAALITLCKRLHFHDLFLNIFSCIGISLVSILLRQYMITDMNLDTIIISAIMPLVPGVAITNAVRDTLMGDNLSGLAKMLEAFLCAASIAIGVGIGMAAAGLLIGREMI